MSSTAITRLSLVAKHVNPSMSTVAATAAAAAGTRNASTQQSSNKKDNEPETSSTFRNRSDYKYFLPIQSRWSDNDQYGHINNSIYYFYIDTVVNEYLIKHCGLDPLDATKTKSIGLVVASNANFYAPAGYPSLLHAGLRIVKLGRSSVTYRVGIFEGDKQQASVVGGFTHVFVDPVERRPVKGLPEEMLSGMRQLL